MSMVINMLRITTVLAILAVGVNASCHFACARSAAPMQDEPPADAPAPDANPVVDDPEDINGDPLGDHDDAGDIVPIDDPALDELLDTLETSADDLKSFTARIVYRKFDDLLGRRETRSGDLIVLSEPVPDAPGAFKRKFAILFDTLVIDTRKSDVKKHYIFDGRWLAEIDHEHKLYVSREIVPPGRVLDPLKLGEGPFPLPIGQRKQRVLERFVVDWAPRPSGLLDELNPEDVLGITLSPRMGTDEAEVFRRVEIYYDKQTLLPVGIDTLEVNGDRKTVLLRNLQRNPDLDEETLEKVTIERPSTDDWTIDEFKWEG